MHMYCATSICMFGQQDRWQRYLSSSAHKGAEDVLVRREPEHISVDVLPASFFIVIQHCRHNVSCMHIKTQQEDTHTMLETYQVLT